jgi:hypothetical protein
VRPPAGRRPPRSVPMPPSKRREHSQTSMTQLKTPTSHSCNNTVQENSQTSAKQLQNTCSRSKAAVECEGCGERDCDVPGPSCPGRLFRIIWNDRKYVFYVFLKQWCGLTRNAALGNMCSSKWFPGKNSILPRSFPGMAKMRTLFGIHKMCTPTVKHQCCLCSPEWPTNVRKRLNMPV